MEEQHFIFTEGSNLPKILFLSKHCDEHLYGKMTIQFKHLVTKFPITRC